MGADERYTSLFSNVLCWLRYIDDVLMLWAGSTETLHHFMSVLSDNKYNLRFTMDCSESSIAFLEVTISLHSSGSLYRKPTVGNTILHATSAHPHSLVQSIPFSQYPCLRRNCSGEESFKHEADLLYDRLIVRAYSRTCLKKALRKAQGKSRDALLFSRPKT